MFSKHESRRLRAERIAGQAWDHLAAAVDATEASTRRQYTGASKKARRQYADTSKKVTNGTKEARRRAAAAYAALSGRRQRTPWEWLVAATFVGAAAGWVATSVTRRVRGGDAPVALPESLADEFARTNR
jgi:hypothetical protein